MKSFGCALPLCQYGLDYPYNPYMEIPVGVGLQFCFIAICAALCRWDSCSYNVHAIVGRVLSMRLCCAPAHITDSKSISSIKTLHYVLQQLFLFMYELMKTIKPSLLSSNIEYTIGVDSVYTLYKVILWCFP